MKPLIISSFLALMGIVWVCSENEQQANDIRADGTQEVIPAAERTQHYFGKLEDKRVGLVGNHSSRIGSVHLVDTLLASGIDLVRIFSPEHGFRGTASAGERVEDDRDERTGLPVISLYGKQKKPDENQLADLDVLLFDIQDVGVRFYTYLSTLHNVMEACAGSSLPMILLDRPNPNAYYIDGPVLDTEYASFIGKHPVPVVYGMTIGEYARMINGEEWLKHTLKCELEVIPCAGYVHEKRYRIPLAPSPNLPDERSVLLYPSLCFFEGTVVSVGRGTDRPFSSFGHPGLDGPFEFTPRSNAASGQPKLEGVLCRGQDLTGLSIGEIRQWKKLEIEWLLNAYESLKDKYAFFSRPEFFDLLAGTDELRNQILDGMSEEQIRQSWQRDLRTFKEIRAKYLLYD